MNIFDFSEKLNKEIGGVLYFVGGCVRDSAMNIINFRSNKPAVISKDLDCELFNCTIIDFELFLCSNNIPFDIEPESKFPVYRVNIADEIIEIGFPRKDNKTGNKHTDFSVEVDPFMSIKEAARRRDFTCNAILQRIDKRECLHDDPFNGIEDIRYNTLRPVDVNTFKEDPLRLFRAFQLIARFGFNFEEVLKIIDQDFLESTKHLSKDSIFKEFEKAILHGKSNHISKALDFLKESGLLKLHFPELDLLSSCEQSPKHHKEGNVWNHTKAVVAEVMKIFEEE